MNEIHFFEGERKEVTAIIRSKNTNEIVVIASARYEVYKKSDGKIIKEGSCEIAGNEATILLELVDKGAYELTVTAHVGREVIIEKAVIKVM